MILLPANDGTRLSQDYFGFVFSLHSLSHDDGVTLLLQKLISPFTMVAQLDKLYHIPPQHLLCFVCELKVQRRPNAPNISLD